MKTPKKILFALILTVIGVSTLLFFSFGDNVLSASSLEFKIPIPDGLALTPNTEIDCRFRDTLFTIDSAGKTIDATTSRSQFGNPGFSVVDVASGKSTAGYVLVPKGGCDAAALDLIIHRSQLWVTWEARDSSGQYKEIEKKSFWTSKTTIPKNFGVGVKSLGQTSIISKDIEDVLGSSPITSDIRVKVSGVLGISYVGFENIKYYYQIDKEKTTISNVLFKIVNPNEVPDEDTRDTDSDGIIDKFDQCKNSKETYNGYKDGDGCPDKLPDEPEIDEDTGEETPPEGNEGSGDEPEGIDSTEECQEKFGNQYSWDSVNNTCIVQSSAGEGVILNAYILVEPKYLDGTVQAFTLPLEGQAAINVDFGGASVIGSFDGTNKKGISDIESSVFIDTGVTTWKVKSHTVTMKPTVRVAGSDIVLDEILYAGFSTSNAKNQNLPKTVSGGQISFTGLSLGTASLRTSEIDLAVGQELVPNGQRRDLELNADITGQIILESNTGVEVSGNLDDGKLNWSLEIERRASDIITERNCPEGQNAVAVEGAIICLEPGESKPTGEQCTLGQDRCEICRDEGAGAGGFPCTKEYRDLYCSVGNQCDIPSDFDSSNPGEIKVPEGCEGKLAIGNSCISTETEPGDDGIDSNDPPKGISGGFFQSSSVLGTGINDTLLLLGGFGIVAAIGIIAYKKLKR